MRTIRVYCDTPIRSQPSVMLTGPSHHHLVNVLRVRALDHVVLFDGLGGEYKAQITKIDQKNLSCSILAFNSIERESKLFMQLAMALISRDKFEWVIQKSVELGVKEIIPIWSQHCSMKLSAVKNKMKHWHAILVHACEQSGRNQLPVIREPINFLSWIQEAHHDHELKLFGSLHTKQTIVSLPHERSERVKILIGPEGGLSIDEEQVLIQHQFQPVSLGPRILRAETAAAVAISLIQGKFGDLK